MSLKENEQAIISEETQILDNITSSLRTQKEHYQNRSRVESVRARELTSRIVASRRDEDKAMLASDEAVSHALEKRNLTEIKTLTKLIKKPYFARIILEEEKDNGDLKKIEYKIGFAANPDCRIIDWRKAPISKLYYEYKEGEDYSEEIQGIERNGVIKTRNTLEIVDSNLKRVTCSAGNFEHQNGEWVKTSSGPSAHMTEYRGELPNVLSLITAEQFKAITEDANSAVLIQGIAGSGKTTVALYRLSWLLAPDNSDLNPEECLVLANTVSLKNYIVNSLAALGMQDVRALTMREWQKEILTHAAPQFLDAERNIRRPATPCPSSIERLKKSVAMLNCLEEKSDLIKERSFEEILLRILDSAQELISHDETRLIDKELVKVAFERTKNNFAAGCLDYCDEAIFLRYYELKNNQIYLKDGVPGKYKHIVVDEVQDLGVIELASVIGATENIKGLTVVGDISQRIDSGSTFPGWDRLKKYWDQKESVSKYLNLKVSHRSTLQIMKLADYIQSRDMVKEGRSGRVPIWFKTGREEKALESAISWLKTALERYPGSLTAVICRDEQQSKYLNSMLKPSFGGAVRVGDSHSFSFEAGILVTDIRLIKGLEFKNVLLWNPSEKNYPAADPITPNLIYTAITRAEENLCMVSFGKPAQCLPNIKSPLLRGYNLVGEELEAS